MRKFLVFFVVLLGLLVCIYRARACLIVPYLQKYISSKIGYDISIENFYVAPFDLSLKNVKVNGVIKADRVTFKLNLFKNALSSSENLKQIEVSNLEVDLNENQESSLLDPNNKNTILQSLETPLDINVNQALIKHGTNLLKLTNLCAHVDTDAVKLKSGLHLFKDPVKFEAELIQKEGHIFDGKILLESKGNLDAHITANGIIDLLSFDTSWNIDIANLCYFGFDFSGSSGHVSKGEKGIDIKVFGDFGKIEIKDSINGYASVDLSRTNKFVSGKLDINFTKQNQSRTLNAKMSKLRAFGFNFETFELVAKENNDGKCKIIFDYGTERKLEVFYFKDGNYESNLIVRNKKSGHVQGNLSTGAIDVNIKNINIADIPIVSVIAASQSCEGMVSISGSMDDNSGQIDLYFNNLKISDIERVDAKGVLVRDKTKYAFKFYKADKSILLENVILNGDIVSTDFTFKEADISNILRIIGKTGIDVSGMTSGHVKYEKNRGANFDIKAFDGAFYGNDFKEFNGKVAIDQDKVRIDQFSIKNSSDTLVDLKGLIGFTDANPESSLYIDIKDVVVRGLKTKGNVEFHGYFSSDKLVTGVVKADKVNIGTMTLGKIEADMGVSTEKIEISNLKSDCGLKASAAANFKKDTLAGSLNFENTNMAGVYTGLFGDMDASVKFSGKLTDPCIEVSAALKNASYLSQPISLSSDIYYKDGVITVNKTDFAVGKSKVFLKGNYSPYGRLAVTVNNLDEKIINMLCGITMPFDGNFSANGEVIFYDKRPRLKILLESKSINIFSLDLRDIKSEIEIVDKNIEIKSASAKHSNSEIKINKGSYDLNSNKYFLDLFLMNIHAGTVDLFGSIRLSGDTLKEREVSAYNGVLDISNLWLNNYKLDRCFLDYSFKNGNLKFSQKSTDIENPFDLSGEIVFRDPLLIKKLNIVGKYSYFDMSGHFSRKHVDFEAVGFDLDFKLIAKLLNCPTILEGNVDIRARLKGSLDYLEGSVSVASKNGTFMSVPFDKLGIAMDSYDSFAYIKEASIIRRNGINVFVGGGFPVYCKNSHFVKPVNITYKIEDSKLSTLNYISKGLLNPISGRLVLNGHIGGSYSNLKSNANLLIYDGTFKSNDYLDRIKNLSVGLSIVDNIVKIDKFFFNSGSGKLNIDGQLKMKNLNVDNFDVRIYTEGKKGIPISIPQLPISKFVGSDYIMKDYSQGKPLFDIKISGIPEKHLISGSVTLENTRFTFPGKKGNNDIPIPASTLFDLKLYSGTKTKFENPFVSALINGSLHISGSVDSLKTSGIIKLKNGRINRFGIDFDIMSSELEIIDDQIYITAEGETNTPSKSATDSEVIQLYVKRTKLSELSTENTINFNSKNDVNMNPQTVFEKVIGMDKTKEIGARFLEFGLGTFKSELARFFDQNFLIPLAHPILRIIGIDNLRFFCVKTDDDEKLNHVNFLSGIGYAMEINFSKNFLLSYGLTFDKFARHNLELQYKLARLSPNLFLKGSYEFDSAIHYHKPNITALLQYRVSIKNLQKKK